MVPAANTSARKPTATQNNRSVSHHPVIRSVATTEVAQPLSMAMTQAAIAVVPPGGVTGALRGGRGIAVVAGSSGGAAGKGPGGAAGRGPCGAAGKGPVGAAERARSGRGG